MRTTKKALKRRYSTTKMIRVSRVCGTILCHQRKTFASFALDGETVHLDITLTGNEQ